MKEFSYGKEGIALSILPGIMILILLILLVALIPGLVIIPWALVSGLPVSLSMVVSYVAVFIACVYGLALLLAQINQYNTIRIMEGGLRITTFGPFLFWKFIPWQDIISLGIAPQKDRWGQPVWVIKVKELTWWHKYLAKMFQMGPNPMITLTSDMEDRELLVELIKQNCPTVKSVTP